MSNFWVFFPQSFWIFQQISKKNCRAQPGATCAHVVIIWRKGTFTLKRITQKRVVILHLLRLSSSHPSRCCLSPHLLICHVGRLPLDGNFPGGGGHTRSFASASGARTSSGPGLRSARVVATGQPILKGFSLTVREGEVHAIMGKNGSGKSTFGRPPTPKKCPKKAKTQVDKMIGKATINVADQQQYSAQFRLNHLPSICYP